MISIKTKSLIEIKRLGFNLVRNGEVMSFKRDYPQNGQYLYLQYTKDCGFEFIGKLAKHLGIEGSKKLQDWQSEQLGTKLAEAFEDNFGHIGMGE